MSVPLFALYSNQHWCRGSLWQSFKTSLYRLVILLAYYKNFPAINDVTQTFCIKVKEKKIHKLSTKFNLWHGLISSYYIFFRVFHAFLFCCVSPVLHSLFHVYENSFFGSKFKKTRIRKQGFISWPAVIKSEHKTIKLYIVEGAGFYEV